jgi:hypothetical protein
MSDVNLIAFGCVVSFIAGAGVYIFIRESFGSTQKRVKAVEVGCPSAVESGWEGLSDPVEHAVLRQTS